MSGYEPGTVAIVTDRYGRSGRGICNAKGGWDFTPEGADLSCYSGASEVTDVRTLVVLDLDGLDVGVIDDVREAVTEYDTRLGPGSALALFEAIADQIEAQTKPPRIPEPGLFGVVRDEYGERWVAIGGHRWTNLLGGRNWPWVDIENPTLIREGVGS